MISTETSATTLAFKADGVVVTMSTRITKPDEVFVDGIFEHLHLLIRSSDGIIRALDVSL